MKEFPEEFELISFFENEPKKLDSDVPWMYNTLTFERADGDQLLTVHISPSYGDFEIYWDLNDDLKFQWKLYGVNSVKIERDKDKEYLRINVASDSMDECLLFVKPSIKILGGMTLAK